MTGSVRQAEDLRRQRAAQGAGAALFAAASVFLMWAATVANWSLVALLVAVDVVTVASILAVRRGHVRLAGYAYSAGSQLAVVLGALLVGTSGQAGFFLCIGVVLATITLPPRDVLIVFLFGLLGHGVLYGLPAGFELAGSLGGAWSEAVMIYLVIGAISLATSASVARLVEEILRRDEEARAADERAEALARDAEHRQRLEALGRLAGGVAHDFNNLLTVMRGCVSMIEPEVKPGTQVHQDVRALADAVDRGEAMTRQLLTFSRRDVVQPAVLDVREVLEGMRDLLRRMLGAGIKLGLEASGNSWPVLASRSQLEQILMNLALNARDAMNGQGELWLRLERGRDPALGEVCRVMVKDSGIGISDEIKARIFEPFFTTKSANKGTGLGLATVYGIATRMGGRIDVESDPGQGATFTVTLPIAHGEWEPVSASGAAKAVGEVLSVCVVDDEPVVRTLMGRVLANAGLQVKIFESAEELLAEPTARCDVLVTDINLPGKNGLALADELRARQPDVRVVLVSGFTSDPAEAARRLTQGAVFLSKPFEPASLIAAVTSTPTVVARAS